MHAARVSFAGLSSLCERILRDALKQRADIDLVLPWTRLDSLLATNSSGTPEILFLELDRQVLPAPLRCLLAAASPLRIVALSPDASAATIFSVTEQRTVLEGKNADDLCELFGMDVGNRR